MNRYARRAIAAKASDLPPQLEADFQSQVLDVAALRHWPLAYHTYRSDRSPKGFPDLMLCKPGRLVALELKKVGGKPTAEQLAWIACLQTVTRVDAMVAWPKDIHAIARLLS